MKNKGFSLIEVILAVSILAIVAIPIIRSFSTAAIANSKAQTTQDATSLSEDIMEKVKSTSIEELYNECTGAKEGKIGENTIDPSNTSFLFGSSELTSTTFTSTPPYKIVYKNITATKGRTFDAEVLISTSEYSNVPDVANGETNIADASDANTFEVPDLKGINSKEHMVMSWEINEYDKSAVDRLVDENAISMSERDTICSKAKSHDGYKTTRIKLESVFEGSTPYIKIDAYVSYEITGYPNAVEFLAFTGTLPEIIDDDGISQGPNIYLFYSTVRGAGGTDIFGNEKVVIEDNTDSSQYKHNVYFILQDGLTEFRDNNGSPTIDIDLSISENGASVISGSSAIHANIVPLTSGGAKLYTNARYGITESNMYDTKVKDRIYYVTVTVSRDGEQHAKLTSTMDTGAEADN